MCNRREGVPYLLTGLFIGMLLECYWNVIGMLWECYGNVIGMFIGNVIGM